VSDLNLDFWRTVAPEIDWRELKIGEVFMLEYGRLRQWSKVVSLSDDSFVCVQAGVADIPTDGHYKVLVMGEPDD
jgi:hypothetical protein